MLLLFILEMEHVFEKRTEIATKLVRAMNYVRMK